MSRSPLASRALTVIAAGFLAFDGAALLGLGVWSGRTILLFVGAILLEQNDEWQIQHRYMTLETMAAHTDEQQATLTHIAA